MQRYIFLVLAIGLVLFTMMRIKYVKLVKHKYLKRKNTKKPIFKKLSNVPAKYVDKLMYVFDQCQVGESTCSLLDLCTTFDLSAILEWFNLSISKQLKTRLFLIDAFFDYKYKYISLPTWLKYQNLPANEYPFYFVVLSFSPDNSVQEGYVCNHKGILKKKIDHGELDKWCHAQKYQYLDDHERQQPVLLMQFSTFPRFFFWN